jgi:hypothetical protein
MGPKSRQEWLAAIAPRYRQASQTGKGKILDEFCAVSGYARKSAIRRLRRWRRRPPPPRRRPGRRPLYGTAEVAVLKTIWLASEQLCSKRLRAALPLWLPHYEARWGALAPTVRGRLLAMSPATMDRLLAPVRLRGRKGRSATRPVALLKTRIPIRTEHWDVEGPGWFEADTVAHCGGSLAGDFIWSLTFTDIWSGWTELRAVWNCGAQGVVEQIRAIEGRLAFPILGFDSDNGSEFLNAHLWRYFAQRPRPVKFTRSRPYRKNDNAHVEQKQWTHVRQLLGYERLDDQRLVEPINELYAGPWSQLHNFFRPSLKLKSKPRLGAKYRRCYEAPQTPCARLLASARVSEEAKNKLRQLQAELDPFELKRAIESQLQLIRSIRLDQRSTAPAGPATYAHAFGVFFY